MQYAIGVDLGGTKTAAGVVSAAGEVLFSETIPTLNRDGGEAILDATAALVSGLMARARAQGLDVSGVGVGSAGVIDAGRGAVVSATDAILGWAGTELTAGLAARLALPPESVRAVNDVHAHALGEAGPGRLPGRRVRCWWRSVPGLAAASCWPASPVLGHRYVGGHVGHFASPFAYSRGRALACVCGSAGPC